MRICNKHLYNYNFTNRLNTVQTLLSPLDYLHQFTYKLTAPIRKWWTSLPY